MAVGNEDMRAQAINICWVHLHSHVAETGGRSNRYLALTAIDQHHYATPFTGSLRLDIHDGMNKGGYVLPSW
jgi:hypothetical protein